MVLVDEEMIMRRKWSETVLGVYGLKWVKRVP